MTLAVQTALQGALALEREARDWIYNRRFDDVFGVSLVLVDPLGRKLTFLFFSPSQSTFLELQYSVSKNT